MKISGSICTTITLSCLLLGFAGCSSGQKEYEQHSPEAEQASFRFANPKLEATLIASEPNIISPVDITWAPDGALYVAEMPGYPLTKDRGAIKKLIDPDGDGFYDKMTVFADDFDFPTSVMYFKGGVLVADAPNIYFLKDTDGDGKADEKEVLLTGFTKGNEQLLVNALQWGLDNWIYGANGRSGGSVSFSDTSDVTSIDNRDFRFDPFNQKLEAISGMSQFGLARDNWGNRFVSYNHRFARQVVLEEKHLDRNPLLVTNAVFDTYQDEHDRRVYTLLNETRRFNRDPIGYFTSLSGLTAYRGHLLGADYEGGFFAGESVQAAVIHRKMSPNGVTFAALDTEEKAEFLASNDDWFHPVNFSNGPDGALYMVDFYRELVEHPQWAQEDKKEGVDWNVGENNGRIWRIAQKDAPWGAKRMQPNLHQAGIEELVYQLGDPAGWRRDMAQQLLVEGQKKEAAPYLEKMLEDSRPFARLHALWTLEGLGLLNEVHILEALNDAEARIQVQGIRLAEKRMKRSESKQLTKKLGSLANHANQVIRFNAILALGDQQEAYVKATLVQSALEYDDFWTRVALLSSTASWAGSFAKKLIASNQGHSSLESNDYQFFRQVGNMVAAAPGNTETETWIGTLTKSANELPISKAAFLAGYLEALGNYEKKRPSFSSGFFSQALNLAKNTSPEVANIGMELLRYADSDHLYQELLKMVLASEVKDIKIVGLQTIAALNDSSLSESLYQNISGFDPLVRKALISSSLGSNAAAHSLFNAIEKQQVDLTEIPEELRQALLAHNNEKLKNRAAEILTAAINNDRQAIIDHYLSSLENQTVDLSNGATIFSTNCSVCHSVKGVGGLLGPDLTNIGNRNDEILLTSILDPSRMVSYELRLTVVATKSGEVFSGTVSAETVSSITIKNPGGEEHTILKENIEKKTVTDQSIMPEGYERIIDEKGMADLIGFLRQPDAIDFSGQ